MNNVTFALCQKPGIGVLMWLSSMCVTNQAIKDVYIDAGLAETTINRDINIAMGDKYFLLFVRHGADVRKLPQQFCMRNADSAESISVEESASVSATVDVATEDGKSVGHYNLAPDCPVPKNQDDGMVGFGGVNIKRGKYRIKIRFVNSNPAPLDHSINVQVLLRGSGTGFP